MRPVEIELANARGVALVDAADIPLVGHFRWRLGNRGYPITSPSIKGGARKSTVQLHRLIMGAVPGQIIDHVDRNPLNNTRANLRFCSQSQNMVNTMKNEGTSRFKGVSWRPRSSRWIAQIGVNRRSVYLGMFVSEAAAAAAYDAAAQKYFGQFAVLNREGSA